MELILLGLFGVTVLVATSLLSRRTGIAAPLLLLLLGIVASFIPWFPDFTLTEHMVLLGILPPLLYATGSNVPIMDLRRNVYSIAWLSVVMVIIPALGIGYLVHWLFPEISLPLGIALGAAVSPTDAVAATSIGRRLGLPDRIMLLLEGESLFNDAAALVTMKMAVAALSAGFSFSGAVASFFWAVGGGILIGLTCGWLLGWVRSKVDDPVLVTVVTLAAPWATFLPAEFVHSSGVISTVVCAVVMAHQAPRLLGPEERAMVRSTWATGAFVLEHGVFLMMGMQLSSLIPLASDDGGLGHVWRMSAVILLALVVFRALGVVVPVVFSQVRSKRATHIVNHLDDRLEVHKDKFIDRFGDDWEEIATRWLNRTKADATYVKDEPISWRGGVVLTWAGMRGVVTFAAIQTLPMFSTDSGADHRAWVVLSAFTVAVASLLLFGGTLPYVIRSLGLVAPGEDERRLEQKQLMKSLFATVNEELGPIDEQVIDGKPVDPRILAQFKQRLSFMSNKANTAVLQAERDSREIYWVLYSRYLQALRSALEEERAIGAYSHHALHAAEQLIDRFDSTLPSGL